MQPEEGTGWLLELLSEVQLQQYFLRLRDDLNVTRLSHFEMAKCVEEPSSWLGVAEPRTPVACPGAPMVGWRAIGRCRAP